MTFVDDETSNFGLSQGRRAMFIVPCASAAEAGHAKGLAEGLDRVWGVRTREDRPQADDSLRHFVIEADQLARLRSGDAPPEMSEETLTVIEDLYRDEDVLYRSAAAVLDDPSGEALRDVLPTSNGLSDRDLAVLTDHVSTVAQGLDSTLLLPFRGAPRTRVA